MSRRRCSTPCSPRTFVARQAYHVFNRGHEKQPAVLSTRGLPVLSRGSSARRRPRPTCRSARLLRPAEPLAPGRPARRRRGAFCVLAVGDGTAWIALAAPSSPGCHRPVYQGRFRSVPVLTERHLLTALRYVEANPVSAGLVDRARDWSWSSRSSRRPDPEAPRLAPWPCPTPPDWECLLDAPQPRPVTNRWRRSAFPARSAERLSRMRASIPVSRAARRSRWNRGQSPYRTGTVPYLLALPPPSAGQVESGSTSMRTRPRRPAATGCSLAPPSLRWRCGASVAPLARAAAPVTPLLESFRSIRGQTHVPRSDPKIPDFARDIKPILERHCFECHGPKKAKGSLRLDLRDRAFRGGVTGPAVVPGDSEQSLIVRRLLGLDGEDRMPLDKDPLPEAQIALIRRWIDTGAAWPPDAAEPSPATADAAPHDAHWAYVRPVRPAIRSRSTTRGPARRSTASSPRASRRKGSSPRPRPRARPSSAASRST